MQRVLVLGRGGAGKSTFARRLGEALDLPVLELDAYFWSADLTPQSAREWTETQTRLASASRWVMDGDLGPYDVLQPRLAAADAVFVLDFPLWRCAWRSLRRGRERGDYWRWVITYRRTYLPRITSQIAAVQENVPVRVLHRPSEVEAALATARA